jgi:phage terminase small subunit
VLNEKQQRFCEEYIIDLNATQAAIRAGYSQATAGAKGHELLKIVEIQEYLSQLRIEQQARIQITGDMVIKELAKVGFTNIQDYIEEGNTVKDFSQIDSGKASCVAGLKRSVTTFGSGKDAGTKETVEFKLWDKVAALEKLGKHFGIFEADNKQQTNHTVNVERKVIDGGNQS